MATARRRPRSPRQMAPSPAGSRPGGQVTGPGLLAQPASRPGGRESGPASHWPARWEVVLHLHVQHGHAELVVW